MRRRDFVTMACQSFLAGISGLLAGCAGGARRADAPRALLSDLARLRSRDYSEVGVCMLLTGEDRAQSVSRKQDLGGTRLAATLDEYARLYGAEHPVATEDDVAALVELIAHRDFEAGGGVF